MASPQAPQGIPSPAIDIDDLPVGLGPNTLLTGAAAPENWVVETIDKSIAVLATPVTIDHNFGDTPAQIIAYLTYVDTASSVGLHYITINTISTTSVTFFITGYTMAQVIIIPKSV